MQLCAKDYLWWCTALRPCPQDNAASHCPCRNDPVTVCALLQPATAVLARYSGVSLVGGEEGEESLYTTRPILHVKPLPDRTTL